MARRLQLPPKLMAQPKFGTRRRAMLSFERQPFPAPCHVDQDIAHSRAGCALGHLTTFDRVLSALHHRNHLPLHRPLHRPANAATAPLYGQHRFAPGVHSRANSGLCATPSSILDSGQAFRAPVVARINSSLCVNQQDGKLQAVRPSPRTQQLTFSLGGQQRAQALPEQLELKDIGLYGRKILIDAIHQEAASFECGCSPDLLNVRNSFLNVLAS